MQKILPPPLPSPPLSALPLARDLLALTERMRERLSEDPFANPVLSVALAEIFPAAADPASERDYAEPRAPRATAASARKHAEIFVPMCRLFDLVREIGTAITHEVGAFG